MKVEGLKFIEEIEEIEGIEKIDDETNKNI